MPPEQREKISQTMKKRLNEPEIKEKWRKAARGRKMSEAAKKKSSATRSRNLTKTQLKKKADRVFSEYVRLRDSKDIGGSRIGVCITCKGQIGANGQRAGQAGHFISRRFLATRWDEKNVHLQCAKCNMWGAGEQYLYSIEVDKMYGSGTAEQLYRLANSPYKLTVEDLRCLISKYEALVKDIKSGKEPEPAPEDLSIFGQM